MQTVINTGTQRRWFRLTAGEFCLNVGANLIEDSILEELLAHPTVVRLFERGTLVDAEEPKADQDFKPGKRIASLSDLKEVEALKAIAACKKPETLRDWINQDPRAKVRKALIQRHRELVPPDANESIDPVKVTD